MPLSISFLISIKNLIVSYVMIFCFCRLIRINHGWICLQQRNGTQGTKIHSLLEFFHPKKNLTIIWFNSFESEKKNDKKYKLITVRIYNFIFTSYFGFLWFWYIYFYLVVLSHFQIYIILHKEIITICEVWDEVMNNT